MGRRKTLASGSPLGLCFRAVQRSEKQGSEPVATDLRSRILREATRLFAEHGYAATSVRELVEAAGCTKPALYYYFESKDALFIEALRSGTADIHALIEHTLRSEGSVRSQLASGLDQFLGFLDENPMIMRLLMRAELQPDEGQPAYDFESLREQNLTMIRQLLEAGVTRGEIRRDVDLGDAALALTGAIDQRIRLWLLGVNPPSDVAERVLRLFFDGVA